MRARLFCLCVTLRNLGRFPKVSKSEGKKKLGTDYIKFTLLFEDHGVQ